MTEKKIGLFLILALCYIQSQAQKYEVKITPVAIENLVGLQSYAVGTYDGDWLLVGGRLDGLHRRQPFASFSADGRNKDLIVVSPATKAVWRMPLTGLPANVQEQLSSTNMQFYQDGDRLICTGGYGYSPTVGDHITYPFLTVIDLPKAIQSIKDGQSLADAISQVENEAFRVTGGALSKIEDVYYLVGGHKFMGRYNPMGPTHGPGFVQEYTNEVRKFTLDTDGDVTVQLLNVIHDELNLHRRDYNLVPYLSDGQRELMVYSGVFQTTVDLPYLYPVSISSDGHNPIESFSQYYNHYHCAYVPIYDSEADEMSTLFFGGIAQFYQEDGWLVQDNDVPFVNTIAEIRRDKNGVMTETVLTDTMPGLLGAGSVFIVNQDLPLADDDIVDASALGEDWQSIGHIYGGIRSSLPNIFWINTGTESTASSTVYEVAIRRRNTLSATTTFSKKDNLQFYPNPAQREVRMAIDLDTPTQITVSISDTDGKSYEHKVIPKQETKSGNNIFTLNNVEVGYGAFFYTVTMGGKTLSRKVIWSK